jgi:type IV secretory pathway TrbD component
MTAPGAQGFEVPLHRSLIEPITMMGLPRSVALGLWTGIAAFLFGGHQLWILPVGLLLHVACVAAAKADPYIFDVFVLALKTQRRLDP